MAFSLSNWFKGKPTGPGSESEGSQNPDEQTDAPAPSAQPARAVRTVMPSSPPQQQQAPVSLRDPSARPPLSLPTAKLPTSGKVTPVLPPARKVSFGSGGGSSSLSDEPVPHAPEPAFVPEAPNVTVNLEIGDFLDRLPPNFLQPGTFDRHKRVQFQASELYSDLSKGRASVPASVIYQRCPEIFARPISDTEDVEIPLPLQKLVEQMGMALSNRTDQVEEENVGQIETPFLQVALEDSARLPTATGSAAGPVRPPAGLAGASPFRPTGEAGSDLNGDAATVRPQRAGSVSPITPVKVPAETPPPSFAPPTAATAGPIIPGKRPPSTVRASVAGGKIRLSGPAVVNRMSPVAPKPDGSTSPADPASRAHTHSQRITLPVQPPAPASPSHQVSKKTARIQIPPISLRPGGPNATPRQGAIPPPPSAPAPAAPGSEPMPNFRPGSGKEVPPAISFRTSPPPPTVKPVPHSFAPPRPPAFPPPAFPVAPPPVPAASVPAPVDERKIELGLAAILRGLPSSMLALEPSSVPDDVRVTLPFALIEPQLSQGRVSVKRQLFVEALPEGHREVLSNGEESADIQIPLQEVFQNLPSNALSLRADQVLEETGVYYPTPFSQKADEDAQRFGMSKAAVTPAAPPTVEAVAPVADSLAEAPAATPESHDDSGADTVTDLPVESLQTPAPATDVELSPDTAPESPRDVPLDLESGPAVESPVVEETVPEAPSAAPFEAKQPEESPTVVADVKLPDLPDTVTEPAASIVEAEPLPDEPIAEPTTLTPPAPIALPALVEEPALEPVAMAALPQPEAKAEIEPAPIKEGHASIYPPAQDSVLQTLFMTEDDLDAKTIVRLVCQLPAVTGCAVMFEDGLRLAGNFPDGDTEGFSAMAAPFFKRAVRFVSELELGTLQTFTLHTENGLLSFFMHENICVSVRHTGRGFLPGVREKLEIVSRELARMYTTVKPDQPAE